MGKNCPACLGGACEIWGTKNQFVFSRCSTCGTIFTQTQGEIAEVQELYDHYYDGRSFEISSVVAESLGRLVSSLEPISDREEVVGILGMVKAACLASRNGMVGNASARSYRHRLWNLAPVEAGP